jgi:N-acetylglutamate synthase-like GNAT family acetyltransferase
MLQIRTMSPEDLPFSVQVTGQMGWNLVEDDFKFMMELEPEGCFIALDNNKRIGLATTISYGDIGWFGNLVVNEAYRNKSAGSQLVKHSIEYFSRKHVKSVGLYAYENRIHFYTRLGFKYDSDFMVMKGKGSSSPANPAVRRAQESDITKIVEYDESCFGSSRKKLLEPILMDKDNICYIFSEGGHVSAYAVAKVYRGMAELGPLVCPVRRSNLALDLLKVVLDRLNGVEVSIFLPTKDTIIINMLKGRRFTEEFRVARMFYGVPIVKECIQAAESLERG